jgi:hypothetical protein
MAKFNSAMVLTRIGAVLSLKVRTQDFVDRPIAFFDTPEGIRIDWESWAGWSEMSWPEFLKNKPTTAKVFRVSLRQVDYYNFTFSDDVKWCSYRLDSPDAQHSVFGYAERGTSLDSTLRPPVDVKSTAVTLALRFPEGAGPGNQVVIDRIISDGWVVESGDAP